MTISTYIKSPLRSAPKPKDRDKSVTFFPTKAGDNSPPMRTDKGSNSFRLVLLGQDGVGKSAIAVRFLCGRYLHEYDPTLESCYEKMEPIDGKTTKVEIFDTANQADLGDYLADADAILFVYSITDRASFERARTFRNQLYLYGKSHLPVLLVGNKKEMERGRCVSFKEGYGLARDSGWTFQEVSAATDTGKLKESILDFIREVQLEAKKVKTSRRSSYFRRAVSALSGHHNNNKPTKDDTLQSPPEWSLGLPVLGNHPRLYQRRLTCPNL